jgi:hypothetical protein
MFRRALNFVMSTVLAVTLIWGGCLSCSNYFRLPAKAAGSCCNPHGGCKDKPGSPKSARECNIQPAALTSAKALDSAIQPSNVSVILPVDFIQLTISSRYHAGFPAALPDRGSPPDLNLLHSVLRV